jgi:3-dehydroquinate synthetase
LIHKGAQPATTVAKNVSVTELSMTTSRSVSYRVCHTAQHVFDERDTTLAEAVGTRPVVLIVDEALFPRYGRALRSYAAQKLHCLGVLRIPGSESAKSLEHASSICAAAFDFGLPRNGAFVAVGGGTVLDLVGFSASIFRRGVAFVRIPTTLIGMIDVGVGIKQAVNFKSKKNALGSFFPPLITINDSSFLQTLPAAGLICGMAEALKMALICDPLLYALLETHATALIASSFRAPAHVATEFLLRAERAMMQQLESNLFEEDLARAVDFGHTFSGVIEIASDYGVPHGEAVALDMLLSTAIAVERGVCPRELLARLVILYAAVGMPLEHGTLTLENLQRALAEARGHRGGNLNLVVPTAIGATVFLQDVSPDEFASALTRIASLRQIA